MNSQLISIIIPIYNEADVLPGNLQRILTDLAVLDCLLEIILVNDGSTDHTTEVLQPLLAQHNTVFLLSLTRNFGKEAAIFAGLEYARGDAVVVMDSDLQHPPSLIPQMVNLWQQGTRVVEACKRSRSDESLLSSLTAHSFYALFDTLTPLRLRNQSDFKLLDRSVVDAYCRLPERERFFRGLVAWMGFDSVQLYFDVPPRQQGKSTWSRLKLLRYSLSALSGFSAVPLHLISLLGLFSVGSGIVVGTIALYDKLSGMAVTGFTTVILLILLIGGSIMIALGLIGIYLEHLFTEIKQRPVYLVARQRSHLREDD